MRHSATLIHTSKWKGRQREPHIPKDAEDNRESGRISFKVCLITLNPPFILGIYSFITLKHLFASPKGLVKVAVVIAGTPGEGQYLGS